MDVIPGAADAERQARAALARHGFELDRIEPISTLHGLKKGRFTFVAVDGSGERIKARCFPAEEEAEAQRSMRDGLEPAFAPVIARDGGVLLEQWVEGTELGPPAWAERAEEAGGLLGRLHSRPMEGDGDSAPYRREAEHDLELLIGTGALDAPVAAAISDRLERLDPGAFRPALIHRDFCAENFVLDRDGRLAMIDNEWFMAGAPGFDLGRTFHRWPLKEPDWNRFLAGYSDAAERPPALGFWTIAATLFGARVYRRMAPPRAEPLLDLLRRAAAGEEPAW